jgi:L-fuculose-phosphate aldolase
VTIDIDRARREIVAVGRRLYERGLVAGAEGNVSVRLDGARVLATPAGASKGFLDPEALVVTDMAGRALAGEGRPSSELRMHLRIYALRPDVHAVVHAHPPTATGFAIAGLSFDACVVPEIVSTLGRVPLVPYGTPSTQELPDRLAPYVAAHDALLLANHGAVAYGPSLPGAINAMESIEQAARSMLVAHLLGRVNLLSREDVDRLLTLDAYGAHPRNPGCTVAGSEPLGGRRSEPRHAAERNGALEREVAEIVREALGRKRT